MEFKLPDIGEGVHEGEIVRWLVKEGDSLAVDQPMVEIMTDKATVEIPSAVSGKVTKLHAKDGEVVKVGQVIMSLDEGGAAQKSAPAPKAEAPRPQAPQQRPTPPRPSAPAPRAAAPAPQPVRQAAPAKVDTYVASAGAVLATPSTRRLARDLGVDLTQVTASGPHGRVTKEDVQKFGGASAAGPQLPVTSQSARPQASTQSLSIPRPTRMALSGDRETLIPFRGIRRKISEAMTLSRSTIPEFNYVDEVDVTELVAFRKEAKAHAEKYGVKLTYLPFICKALIRGLKEFPPLNSQLDEPGGNIIQKNYYNIGIAVDTPAGLMVPNIKNADQKSILEIANEIQSLADKARNGKLAIDDMKDGTFTITNPGPIGGLFTAPVINYPEVAILGIHKIVRRPIVEDDSDAIKIASMMYLSLSVDHRVVDGATAARFCNVLIEYLSSPKKMMLDMS